MTNICIKCHSFESYYADMQMQWTSCSIKTTKVLLTSIVQQYDIPPTNSICTVSYTHLTLPTILRV